MSHTVSKTAKNANLITNTEEREKLNTRLNRNQDTDYIKKFNKYKILCIKTLLQKQSFWTTKH